MRGGKLERVLRRLESLEFYNQGAPRRLQSAMGRGRVPIRLNVNENLFVPREVTIEVARRAAESLDHRLYPDGIGKPLLEKLAGYLGVDEENIVLGCGCDQLVDLLITTIGRGGVCTVQPTYAFYRVRCALYGVPYRYTFFRDDLSVDVDHLLALLGSSDMLILCSPNNPTGHKVSREVIEGVAESFDGVVVIDETYAEFSDEQLHRMPLDFENVIVMRTFSKSFAAAGIRLGYLVAPERIASVLRRLQMPYPVPAFSLKYAEILLDMVDYFKAVWDEVRRVRSWFYNVLRSVRVPKFRVFESYANFVSVGIDVDGSYIIEELMQRGYLVRVFPDVLGHKTLVRITLAPKEILEGFVGAFLEVLSNAVREN